MAVRVTAKILPVQSETTSKSQLRSKYPFSSNRSQAFLFLREAAANPWSHMLLRVIVPTT